MSSFRTEISIPVNKDSRTFEKRRSDIFDKLEEKYAKPEINDNSRLVNQTRSSHITNSNNNSLFETDNFFNRDITDWDHNVSDWLSNSRKKWNEEMNLLKSSMFSLESGRDKFDLNSWDPWKNRSRIDDFSRHGGEVQREHTITTLPGGNQHLRETKQSTFLSSSHPIDFTDNASRNQSDLKPVYEIGTDGQLYFKLRFESKNFKPEDIKVTCSDSHLNICAKKNTLLDNSPTIELQKSIFIPSCVNSQQFQCQLTEDGILVLEAPVMSPEYSRIVAKDAQTSEVMDRSSLMKIRNTTGPVVLCDENGKRIHLEIHVDREYVPSDFSVTTDMNKISVKGRHEVKTLNSSSFKEFSKFYEVPEHIDPMSVTFSLIDGILIIEALVA